MEDKRSSVTGAAGFALTEKRTGVQGADGRMVQGADGRMVQGADGRMVQGADGRMVQGADGRMVRGADGRMVRGAEIKYSVNVKETLRCIAHGAELQTSPAVLGSVQSVKQAMWAVDRERGNVSAETRELSMELINNGEAYIVRRK